MGYANIRDDKAVSDDYFDDCIGFICAIILRTSSYPATTLMNICPRNRTPHVRVCIAYVMLFV